jgi:hypothetical protein
MHIHVVNRNKGWVNQKQSIDPQGVVAHWMKGIEMGAILSSILTFSSISYF